MKFVMLDNKEYAVLSEHDGSYIITGVDRRNGKILIGGIRKSIPKSQVEEL